jgi:predicted anti-sigma-YlaC factor YlaD
MKCSDARKDISRGLDGELAQSGSEGLAGHLAVCEECRAYRSLMSRLFSVHSDFEEIDPPAGLVPSVMSAIEDRDRRGRQTWWFRFAVPAAAATVVFLGVLAGGRLAEMAGPANGNGQTDVFGLEYLEELPPGSIGDMMLADSEGGNGDER